MQISNQDMDETIEEEMSQDMEKGFSVLGTAFGVFNWIEETCLWGSFEACLCSDTCKWLDSVVFLVKDEKPLFSSRSTVCLGCKRTTSDTVKNDRLYPNLRKKRTFRNATTGLPAKWRLRNDRRNSILMTRHYPGARFSKGPPKNLSG